MYIIKKHKEKIEENGRLKTFNQNLTNKYNNTKTKYDELRKMHDEYLRDTSKRLQERNNNVLKLTSENNQLYAKLQELMHQNDILKLQLDALKFNDTCTPTTNNTTNISES
jgi:predicted nuclease with TOPRIM domain